MNVVVQLEAKVAQAFQSSQSDAVVKKFTSLLKELDVSLMPMFSGVDDENLPTYFVADVPDQKAESILERLRQQPFVLAAYSKPMEGPP